jgi:putative tryptophan/tyrosine transport system substrate-binding protein
VVSPALLGMPVISRRRFLTGFVIALSPLGSTASAQEYKAGKVYRIGVLERTSLTLNAANFDAFREGLRELGYVEGKNLIIEYRSVEGRSERFLDLATELVGLKVDLIVTRGTPAALAAKKATGAIPVVMAASGDPVGGGIVTSLARPGGNVTGLSAVVADVMGKRLELLREAIPAGSQLAALLNMSNPAVAPEWEELEATAQRHRMKLQLLDVRTRGDLERAFEASVQQHIQALVVGIDDLTLMHRRIIVDLAAKHRLPAIYASKEFVDAGGLMTYGVNYPHLYRRAATYVDKILRGTKPADLPVEQPTKFELVINLKTAKALGLTIPQSVLLRADQIIE